MGDARTDSFMKFAVLVGLALVVFGFVHGNYAQVAGGVCWFAGLSLMYFLPERRRWVSVMSGLCMLVAAALLLPADTLFIGALALVLGLLELFVPWGAAAHE